MLDVKQKNSTLVVEPALWNGFRFIMQHRKRNGTPVNRRRIQAERHLMNFYDITMHMMGTYKSFTVTVSAKNPIHARRQVISMYPGCRAGAVRQL